MRRLAVALLFLLATSSAHAQTWAPIPPTDTGPQLVTHINETDSGPRPQEHTLSCYPGPGFFPAARLLKHVGCKGCSPTNPCTPGSYTLDAVVSCDPDGVSNCVWNCNHGTPPDQHQFFAEELGAPVAVSTSTVNVLTANITAGTSPTNGWLAGYTATVTLTVDPSTSCDVALHLDGSGTPVRIGSVQNGANADTITSTLTLAASQVVNATTTSATIFAKASGAGCTINDAAGELTGALTRVDVTVSPK